jgi:outer membrane protein W
MPKAGWRNKKFLKNIIKAFTSIFLLLILPVVAHGQDRELGAGLGIGLGDFHGCPAFGLTAAFPLSLHLSIEAESFYYFNPAEKQKDPPAGFHQSSMAADLGLSAVWRFGKKGARFNPFAGAGLAYLYSSVLTEHSPSSQAAESRSRLLGALAAGVLIRISRLAGLRLEARELIISAGGGQVLRMAAAFYTYF